MDATAYLGQRDRLPQAAAVTVGSVAVCVAYAAAANAWSPDYAPTTLEFWGTATSLACVWLVRKQNMMTWPIGIVSVVLMGLFFLQIDLVGQAALQLAYYFPIQWWGWWMWAKGGEGRTELKVSWMTARERVVWLPVLAAGTWLAGRAFQAYPDAVYAYWDASIVAASVLAQFLLSRKKVESWVLWMLPVNVSAIALYAATGAHMFAALYVVFLANAAYGMWEWARDERAGRQPGMPPVSPAPAPSVSL